MERADRLTTAGTPGFALMMSAGQAVAEAAMDLVEEGPSGGRGLRQQWRRRLWRQPGGGARPGSRRSCCASATACRATRRSLLAAGSISAAVQPGNRQAGTIIDALFGAGLDRVKDDPLEMIEAINANGAPVLAVDLPAGSTAPRAP
jgi:NAD(P)H-hydrate repair Nnr-like enzyme with NAD(P)H-hydrate epimerase domain